MDLLVEVVAAVGMVVGKPPAVAAVLDLYL
jgi:hypothetical protein